MRTSSMPPATGADRRSGAAPRKNPRLRRPWCCPFGAAPQSPDCRSSFHPHSKPPLPPPPAKSLASGGGSFPSSPSPSAKLGLGLIDPRRIRSPGRVSPIDSDAPFPPITAVAPPAAPEVPDPPPKAAPLSPARPPVGGAAVEGGGEERSLDLRLRLKGRDGRFLVMELDSEVLCKNSSFFAGLVLRSRRRVSDALQPEGWEIEVADVEDLGAFKETIELMFENEEEGLTRDLMRVGVSRSVGILEVSSKIMFDRGVMSCLKYIEAVPWSESEEEKLKNLFARYTFDEAVTQDVLTRLYPEGPSSSENLAVQLIQSIATATNGNARRELQSLVNGLLSKSSVYQKDPAGLNKESLYDICNSCLNALVELFEEASDSVPVDRAAAERETKPLVERVSKQVENLNWLLEILIDRHMAEEFVCLWADQKELIRMHKRASPMVRYELSRISAGVFVALGRGKLQCPGDLRFRVLKSWFGLMLMDFGWLQRCPKGLDMRMLEEGLGQAILTLPLKQQQSLFEEWFRSFGVQGTECPNLSKAFQVWWRRSFIRNTGTQLASVIN